MSYLEASWWPLLLITVAVLFVWKLSRSLAVSKLPLPPGPPPHPIIGNLLDIPKVEEGRNHAFRDLNAKYGEVVYLSAFGQPMILLGTQQAALDLLEKRSANYADKMEFTMPHLSGWSFLLATMSYGPLWKRIRRAVHEHMSARAVAQHHSVRELETRRYLLRMVERPQDFLHHGRRLFSAAIIRVGYGIDIDKSDIDYLSISKEAMDVFYLSFLPGQYLVEIFSILRYLPLFFPGARFKRQAAKRYPIVRRMVDVPWDAAMDALCNGRNVPSMFSSFQDRISRLEGPAAKQEEEISKNAIANLFVAGGDTTLSAMQTFYLAMACYPEVQKRAQDELDAVIGPDRLPTMDDMNSLPYINALIKECLRWHPVIQLQGLVSREEDEYKGYRIPKGSIVIPNLWAYTRDPAHYPDPETFDPERFLLEDGKPNEDALDPNTIVFAHGRRFCPGRHFANAALFTAISAVLHTLSIAPPLDGNGQPVPLLDTVDFHPGLISHPEPFECVIKPRSAEAEALIRASYSESEERINM